MSSSQTTAAASAKTAPAPSTTSSLGLTREQHPRNFTKRPPSLVKLLMYLDGWVIFAEFARTRTPPGHFASPKDNISG